MNLWLLFDVPKHGTKQHLTHALILLLVKLLRKTRSDNMNACKSKNTIFIAGRSKRNFFNLISKICDAFSAFLIIDLIKGNYFKTILKAREKAKC